MTLVGRIIVINASRRILVPLNLLLLIAIKVAQDLLLLVGKRNDGSSVRSARKRMYVTFL